MLSTAATKRALLEQIYEAHLALESPPARVQIEQRGSVAVTALQTFVEGLRGTAHVENKIIIGAPLPFCALTCQALD